MSQNVTLQLAGLHCQACVGRVKAALAPHAQSVDVQLSPAQTATLIGTTAATQTLIDAVTSAGAYTATPVEIANKPAANIGGTFPKIASVSAQIPVKPKAVIEPQKSWAQTYFPLLLLSSFLAAIPALAQWHQPHFDGHAWMRHFMAAFFLAFSFFKLLDVRAFAQAYAGYDLIAKAWAPWGLIYPFVELALGIAYLVNFNPPLTNAVTLVVMGVSLLGVVRAVMSKQQIRCACLGAVFQLPMSTVTIVEDALMVAMAAWMLFFR